MKDLREVSNKLNRINTWAGCNSIRKSVSVQKLIRWHGPRTIEELHQLIADHREKEKYSKCACGAKSAGTVEDFGDNLYAAVLKHQIKTGEELSHITRDDARNWMGKLFGSQSLKGRTLEDECIKLLNKSKCLKSNGLRAKATDEELDCKYAIDVLITDKEDNVLCGIQVKSTSYKRLSPYHRDVKSNIRKNRLYDKPVLYIYYDTDNDYKFVKTGFSEELETIISTYKNNK